MTHFRQNFINICLILSLGLLLFFPRLGSLPYRGEEPRRVVSSFEMMQSGNWFVPTIQNQVFLSRPPLQNWVIAITGELRGSFDHLTGRLPSALCALLTALLIYYYCLASLSTGTALLSALCFLTIPQVLQLGRTAETELMFTFLLSGSFLLWHRGELSKWSKYFQWGIAYLFLAGATLAKGINQAPVYFGLIIGLYLLLNRRIKELFTPAHLIGLGLFCALVGYWQWGFIRHVGSKTGWLMHAGDVGLRFQDFGLNDYLLHGLVFPLELFSVLLPWSLFLFAYLNREFWSKTLSQESKAIALFCLGAIAITFLTVWIPPGSRTRYFMPLFPCVSILAAIVLHSSYYSFAQTRRFWHAENHLYPKLLTWGMVLLGCINFIWSYFGIQIIQPAEPIFNASLFLVGTSFLGLALYKLPKLNRHIRLYVPVLIFGLFSALTINLLYTDSRLQKYNDVEGQLVASLKKIPEGYPLVSDGTVAFDFLYYYMLHTGRTIPVVSHPALLKPNPESWVYYCANSSIPLPPFAEQLAEIETGRYKQAYSKDMVQKTTISRR